MSLIKQNEKSIARTAETVNAYLEYSNGIMFVELKEDPEPTIESMTEHFKIQGELAGNDIYAVLVDGTKTLDAPPEVRQFIANHNPPNKIAMAILINNSNIAWNLIINFYLKVNKPKVTTKLFNKKDEAVAWLKGMLNKAEIKKIK